MIVLVANGITVLLSSEFMLVSIGRVSLSEPARVAAGADCRVTGRNEATCLFISSTIPPHSETRNEAV